MFLMVFALPVIGCDFPVPLAPVSDGRWSACWSPRVVALSQAPELRWYASGLFGSDAWLTWLFGNQSAVPQPSFSGFYAPSSYLIVLLEVFAILMLACAVAAEYRRNDLRAPERAHRHGAHRSGTGPGNVGGPHRAVAAAGAARSILTRCASCACERCRHHYLRAGDIPLEGRQLFEALQFSYPDIVQELIVGSDGGRPRR